MSFFNAFKYIVAVMFTSGFLIIFNNLTGFPGFGPKTLYYLRLVCYSMPAAFYILAIIALLTPWTDEESN